MATNPASVLDVVSRSLRTLSDAETAVAVTLLDDAWTIILSRSPSVGTRLDVVPMNLVFAALVTQVECAMVLRVLMNPDGKREEHGDDYGYTIDSTRSTGALYLSDDELLILGMGDSFSDNAFTIRPAGFTDSTLNASWGVYGSMFL